MSDEIWIPANIQSDPRVLALRVALDISQVEAVGVCVTLWMWAKRHASNGDVAAFSASNIATAIGWKRGTPRELLAGLEEAGVIKDGLLTGWDDINPPDSVRRKREAEFVRHRKAYRERKKRESKA